MEIKAALRFAPKLGKFILATTAPRDTAVQRLANQTAEKHRKAGLFTVEVWTWEDIRHELYRRQDLFDRIASIYWPLQVNIQSKSMASVDDLILAANPYLEYLAPQCQRLPLLGLDPKAKDSKLTLDAVYTALDTKTSASESKMEGKQRDEQEKPLSALQAVLRDRWVVLKGDPGSGKSTFLSYLSLCLAKHHLEPEGQWLKRLEGWPAKARWIPITIVLRDFARGLPESLPEPCARVLWDFFLKTLADLQLGSCSTVLEAAVEQGHAVVFLDGLDEVPTDSLRDFVRATVSKFAERHKRVRLVLTCRTMPYEAMRLEGATDFELAPFDNKKIVAFIGAWYSAHVPKVFSTGTAEERRRALEQAVQRPELRRLAGNPMLLTDMALLHTHRGRLPDDRAELYKEVIDLLLLRWDETKQGRRLQDLLREAERDVKDLLRTLGAVAFSVHTRSRNLKEDETGDIPRHELLDALEDLHPKKSLDWAMRVIETIQERAGLLIAREERVFIFPHRSFQEYLAALHLTKDRDFAAKAVELLDEIGYWREVIRWAAGRVTHVDDVIEWKGFALLRKLCPNHTPPDRLPWRRIWLAGECLLEMSLAKVNQFDEGPELVDRIRELLKELLALAALSPRERADAAAVLGQLGDDRSGVGVCELPDKRTLPNIDWIEIAPGPFTMGSKENDGYADERPQFECKVITRSYRINRYPVTVRQFEMFVAAGGYEEKQAKDWWTEGGWKWKTQNKIMSPEDYSPVFQTPNHPRVGVSWYEAMAFCRWLSEQLKLKITLPNEPEWERAARHTNGRIYPWGTETQDVAQRCNIDETKIGHTSAVGMFPNGHERGAAADMAGNVWEWTRSLWGEDWQKPSFGYPYTAVDEREGYEAESDVLRVLRGGSWGIDADYARCADRFRYVPFARLRNLGFRVVASPFSDL